jgi:hypothetical protein
MRYLASRCLGIASSLVLVLSACAAPGDSSATPTGPEFGKGKSGGSDFAPMTISPTSQTIAVGGTTSVSVTYRDAKGIIVPETNFRWTYYGCIAVAPLGADCNSVISILPVSPYLRQAEIKGMAAGAARLYASDGLGTYVWADLIIK